jgi:hypothetical protein
MKRDQWSLLKSFSVEQSGRSENDGGVNYTRYLANTYGNVTINSQVQFMYSNTNLQRKNNIIIAPKIPLMSTRSRIRSNFVKLICAFTGTITVKLVTGSK